ncbi:phosphoribosyltransferase [Xanthomonas citri]|uniref:phosphoribosyltransferase n=1 Tax=Xanthomonas citri TaxID=346 RepID=UPI000A2FB501|nr:phosphoribosyltransferase [Xanthomonas citri]ARR15357.1 hypothetical protein B7L66_24685 [Xanthomonas citri pv. citri]ARR19986.1 hypothetical protein B7L65_24335 [Xanthomonas citri pv. citri]ARR24731.1 hypothetical protein B7L67_24900 [Xanthomonas citri pv. citri]
MTRKAERAPWGDFPPVIRNGDLKALEREPEYIAAKSGDADAAVELVDRLLTEATARQIGDQLRSLPDVRLLPVLALEASGANKIPLAVAEVLGDRLGIEVEHDIVQAERVNRTGSATDHRLAYNPTFDGPVKPGRSYFIVDDSLTMGGTIASLRGYVVNRGGLVAGAAVMTAHEGALRLPVTEKTLAAIQQKHGDAMKHYWQQEFGYDLSQLTNGEAGHLRAAPSVDAIRTRIAAARNARGWPAHEASPPGTRPEAPERLSLLSAADYRARQLAQRQSAYQHADAALWAASPALTALRAEIDQQAASGGPAAAETVAALYRGSNGPSDLTMRFQSALEATPGADVLVATARHALRRWEKLEARPAPPSPDTTPSP